MKACLDMGNGLPGLWRRPLRLTGADGNDFFWNGHVNTSTGLMLRDAGSSSLIEGARRPGLLSLLAWGRWDFRLDGSLLCSANVRKDGRYGFEIGGVHHPLCMDRYARTPVIEENGWKVDRLATLDGCVTIESPDREGVLALACVVALYEAIRASR